MSKLKVMTNVKIIINFGKTFINRTKLGYYRFSYLIMLYKKIRQIFSYHHRKR